MKRSHEEEPVSDKDKEIQELKRQLQIAQNGIFWSIYSPHMVQEYMRILMKRLDANKPCPPCGCAKCPFSSTKRLWNCTESVFCGVHSSFFRVLALFKLTWVCYGADDDLYYTKADSNKSSYPLMDMVQFQISHLEREYGCKDEFHVDPADYHFVFLLDSAGKIDIVFGKKLWSCNVGLDTNNMGLKKLEAFVRFIIVNVSCGDLTESSIEDEFKHYCTKIQAECDRLDDSDWDVRDCFGWNDLLCNPKKSPRIDPGTFDDE